MANCLKSSFPNRDNLTIPRLRIMALQMSHNGHLHLTYSLSNIKWQKWFTHTLRWICSYHTLFIIHKSFSYTFSCWSLIATIDAIAPPKECPHNTTVEFLKFSSLRIVSIGNFNARWRNPEWNFPRIFDPHRSLNACKLNFQSLRSFVPRKATYIRSTPISFMVAQKSWKMIALEHLYKTCYCIIDFEFY